MAGFDKYVKSLLHCNENFSGLINDEVISNNWSLRGQPRISKINSKFNLAYHFDSGKLNYLKLDRKIKLGGTNDFTLDFWIFNKENSSGRLFEFIDESFNRLLVSIEDNKIIFSGKSDNYKFDFSFELTLNTLNHISIICYSEISRFYFYLNGEKQGVSILKIPEGDYEFSIGDKVNLSNLNLSISEIRLSDFRRWKSNFTNKLNEEHLLDSNDIFFLKFRESIIDSEALSLGFSVYSGYHELVKFNSPFKTSLYLDGNAKLESNGDIQLGKKDFCLDGWILIESKSDNSLSSIINFNNILRLDFDNESSSLSLTINEDIKLISGIWANQLFHFAIVFKLSDSNSINLYLNGQKVLKIENVVIFNELITGKLSYGDNLKCYLSELRISYGVVRFIGNYIPSRLPYSKDTYSKSTEVLLHLNQTSLLDERGNDWRLIDNSIYFTSDGARFDKAIELYHHKQYLYLPELILGLTDFTIEFWTTTKYPDNKFRDSEVSILYLSNQNNTQVMNLSVVNDNLYRLYLLLNSEEYLWEFSAEFNNLYHIAIVYYKDLEGLKLYLNGKPIEYREGELAIQLIEPIKPDEFRIYLGSNPKDRGFYRGTLNEFRISDVARYSEGFTPESKEFISDKYTMSLLPLIDSAYQDLADNEWILVNEDDTNSAMLTDNSIFGKALILYKYQYLKMKGIIYLGGQDFTIDLYAKINLSTGHNESIFELYNIELDSYIRLLRYKDSQRVCLRIKINEEERELISSELEVLNEFHYYSVVYNYELKTLSFYIDNFRSTKLENYSIERQVFNFNTLGKSYFSKYGKFEGILDEFRIIDGIAIWTKEEIDLPERESLNLTNIDKFTEVLFHFDESPVKDESGKLWIKEGLSQGVKLSPLQFKFPYQSAYFDGSSRLRLMNKLQLGDSDFLINFYINLERLSLGEVTKVFQIYNNQFTLEKSIQCYIDNESGKVIFSVNYSDKLESKSILEFNRFYRISILYKKELNTFILYIDNKEEDIIYYSLKFTEYPNVVLGDSGADVNTYSFWRDTFFSGYLDEFKITEEADSLIQEDINQIYSDKNKSFIIDNFTKSLLQFKDYRLQDSFKEKGLINTWNFKGDSIILHLDESFPNSFESNIWNIEGNPEIKPCEVSLFSDESITYAYYNNGKDFYYLYNDNVNLDKIFNNDFTLDFWVYLDSIEHNQGFIASNMPEEYWSGFAILCANKYLRFVAKYNDSWHDSDFFRLSEKEWIHIALVRQGNNLSGYKNGILKRTIEIGDLQGIEHQINIGYWYRTGTGYGGLLNGYLREVRITNSAIWVDTTFELPKSRNDNFNLIMNNPIKNSFSLLKNQYLEKDIPVELLNDFTVEGYVKLNQFQTFFSLIGNSDSLEIKTNEDNSLILSVNENDYELFRLNSLEDEIFIALEYLRRDSIIRIYRDSNLIKILNGIEILDSEFRIFLGKGISKELNGLNLVNEFRISSISRNKYSLKEQNNLSEVFDRDLVLLQFKDNLLEDRVADNKWRVEGEKNLLPEVISGEEYFSFSRFGNCLYLPEFTYLESEGLELGGQDFSIESWVYLLNKGVLFCALEEFTNDKFFIELTLNFIRIKFNNYELRLEESISDLIHLAVEYQYEEKKLILYINGEERTSLRDLEIPKIEFNKVFIGFNGKNRYSSMYLDEFRISNGIARWRGNFRTEVKPYRLLLYPKKLAIRNKESGLIEYISLYYDIPEKGYSIFDKDSNIEVYAEVKELEDKNFYSNLVSRINTKEYILPREVITAFQKSFNCFFRLNKDSNELEYSFNGIQEYKPITSILSNDRESLLGFNPVLVNKDDIQSELNLSDYINIYRKSEENQDYIYYRFSYVKLDSTYELYLSFKQEDNLEIILNNSEGLNNLEYILQIYLLINS